MSHRFSWSAFWAGIRGGFFATLVMTVFRAPTAQSLPPTTEFLERYLRGGANEYTLSSLALHFLYGTSAGAVFGPVFATVVGETNEPETVGIVVGTIYGLAMSVFGHRVILERFLGMDLTTDEEAVFHAGHLIYGLVLGVWVGSRS